MEWAREPSVRWKPPPLRVVCGSGREVTLSLTGKKNGSRTECRSTSRRSVRSTQNPLAVRKVGRRVVLHCSNNIRKPKAWLLWV